MGSGLISQTVLRGSSDWLDVQYIFAIENFTANTFPSLKTFFSSWELQQAFQRQQQCCEKEHGKGAWYYSGKSHAVQGRPKFGFLCIPGLE